MILLPEIDLDIAHQLMDRLRLFISSLPIQIEDGTTINVTASVGLAMSKHHNTIDAMTQHADQCLYKAKDAGRNAVVS